MVEITRIQCAIAAFPLGYEGRGRTIVRLIVILEG